jgi:hypothetical protein
MKLQTRFVFIKFLGLAFWVTQARSRRRAGYALRIAETIKIYNIFPENLKEMDQLEKPRRKSEKNIRRI